MNFIESLLTCYKKTFNYSGRASKSEFWWFQLLNLAILAFLILYTNSGSYDAFAENNLLDMIHKTGYGLSSSIFGRDKKRIQNIIRHLKIGNVSINDVMTHYGIASLPFGGEGLSGIGRLHGAEGLKSLCRIKSVVINRFNFINEPWWYGRSKLIEGLLKKAINILYK